MPTSRAASSVAKISCTSSRKRSRSAISVVLHMACSVPAGTGASAADGLAGSRAEGVALRLSLEKAAKGLDEEVAAASGRGGGGSKRGGGGSRWRGVAEAGLPPRPPRPLRLCGGS